MMVLTNKKFAKNLLRLRGESGLAQYALARELQLKGSSMSRSTYAKIELGQGNIKASDLVALKEIYGVSYDEFFKDVSIIETENE